MVEGLEFRNLLEASITFHVGCILLKRRYFELSGMCRSKGPNLDILVP